MTRSKPARARSIAAAACLLLATSRPAFAQPAPVTPPPAATTAAPATSAPPPQLPAIQPPASAPTPSIVPTPPAATTPLIGRISILTMVRASDPVVKAVMLLLILCSLATWAVLIEKTIILAQVRRHIRRFGTLLSDAATMDDVAAAISTAGPGPARQLWLAARQEWDLSLQRIQRPYAADQMSRLLQRLTLAIGVAEEQALSRLGNWMGLLATVGATAPFVGLFGTVWGILHSFAQIAATRSTSLAVVAPGIAEALLTTAVGLFAAIPATVFYNRFARSTGKITGALDNVAATLLTLASRESEKLAR